MLVPLTSQEDTTKNQAANAARRTEQFPLLQPPPGSALRNPRRHGCTKGLREFVRRFLLPVCAGSTGNRSFAGTGSALVSEEELPAVQPMQRPERVEVAGAETGLDAHEPRVDELVEASAARLRLEAARPVRVPYTEFSREHAVTSRRGVRDTTHILCNMWSTPLIG